MSDLSRQAGILSLADFLRFFIKTIIGIALARLLSPADLGTYRQLFLIYGTLAGILMLGFPQSMLYFLPKAESLAEARKVISRTLNIISILAIICALVILFSRGFIARIFSNPSLKDLLPIYSIYPLFIFVGQMYSSIMLGLKQTHKSAWFSLFSIACDLILILGSALVFKDMAYIVWAIVFSAFIQWLWAYIGLRDLKCGFSKENFRGFKAQLNYTIPLGLSLLVGIMSVQLDKIMVSGFFTPQNFAVFSLGAMELPLIGILINSVNSVLLPNLNPKDPSALGKLYRASVRKNALFIFPLTVVFFIFAQEFMVFIYGSLYASAALYFRWYLLILPLRVATYGIIFQAMGKTKLVMIDSVVMLVLNAVLNYILIGIYGMQGAAIATLLVSWLIVGLYLFQMQRNLKLKVSNLFPTADLLMNTLVALIPIPVVLPVARMIVNDFLRMIIGGCLYMLLYFLSGLLLRVIKTYDLSFALDFVLGFFRKSPR
jgi:O-antigen/teichoic acid export membrane protein